MVRANIFDRLSLPRARARSTRYGGTSDSAPHRRKRVFTDICCGLYSFQSQERNRGIPIVDLKFLNIYLEVYTHIIFIYIKYLSLETLFVLSFTYNFFSNLDSHL